MITVEEAERLIASSVSVLPAENVPVARARGRVLRESICAERDQPPFDRATMDGVALSSADTSVAFEIVGETAAGSPAGRLESHGQCIDKDCRAGGLHRVGQGVL